MTYTANKDAFATAKTTVKPYTLAPWRSAFGIEATSVISGMANKPLPPFLQPFKIFYFYCISHYHLSPLYPLPLPPTPPPNLIHVHELIKRILRDFWQIISHLVPYTFYVTNKDDKWGGMVH